MVECNRRTPKQGCGCPRDDCLPCSYLWNCSTPNRVRITIDTMTANQRAELTPGEQQVWDDWVADIKAVVQNFDFGCQNTGTFTSLAGDAFYAGTENTGGVPGYRLADVDPTLAERSIVFLDKTNPLQKFQGRVIDPFFVFHLVWKEDVGQFNDYFECRPVIHWGIHEKHAIDDQAVPPATTFHYWCLTSPSNLGAIRDPLEVTDSPVDYMTPVISQDTDPKCEQFEGFTDQQTATVHDINAAADINPNVPVIPIFEDNALASAVFT